MVYNSNSAVLPWVGHLLGSLRQVAETEANRSEPTYDGLGWDGGPDVVCNTESPKDLKPYHGWKPREEGASLLERCI